jgi:hypothetical protein
MEGTVLNLGAKQQAAGIPAASLNSPEYITKPGSCQIALKRTQFVPEKKEPHICLRLILTTQNIAWTLGLVKSR